MLSELKISKNVPAWSRFLKLNPRKEHLAFLFNSLTSSQLDYNRMQRKPYISYVKVYMCVYTCNFFKGNFSTGKLGDIVIKNSVYVFI